MRKIGLVSSGDDELSEGAYGPFFADKEWALIMMSGYGFRSSGTRRVEIWREGPIWYFLEGTGPREMRKEVWWFDHGLHLCFFRFYCEFLIDL